MITKDEAVRLAEMVLQNIMTKSNIKVVLLYDETIEFEYGWMFFYQSEEYVRTGNLGPILGGNAPIIVDKSNATVHTTGTRRSENFYIENYCKYRDDIEMFRKAIR